MAKQMREAARAAKEIKKKLRDEFPDTKFSVTSEYFAGGNAVDVKWTDGPTRDGVRQIARKHQYGSVTARRGSYDYDNTQDDIPQAKFVNTKRIMSAEVGSELTKEIKEKWANAESWSEMKIDAEVWKEFTQTNFMEESE